MGPHDMVLLSLWTMLFTALAFQTAPPPALPGENAAPVLREKYLALTRGWAEEAVFTAAENRAMQEGRSREAVMTSSLNDSLAREVLQKGEPSFNSLAAFYPGKVLDRTLLGSFSDPRSSDTGSNEEFVIWWNGAISANLLTAPWPDGPRNIRPVAENTNVLFRVSPAKEMFGKVGERYARISYEDGYLPIVQATYNKDGVRYAETALADRPSGDTQDTAYIRFELKNVSATPRAAELHEDITLIDGSRVTVSGKNVFDSSGAVVMAFEGGQAVFDANRQELTHRLRLEPGTSASIYLKIPYAPESAPKMKVPSAEDFTSAHAKVRGFWIHQLSTGMQIRVPEQRVNDMWRALLLQNFVIADGPRFTYGSGLAYNDAYFPFENGFAALTMARYGFGDDAEAWLNYLIPASVDPKLAHWRYQNRRAIPLHLLYSEYQLTGRSDYFEKNREELYRVAEEIIRDRHSTMTSTAVPKPWHWGLLPPALPAVDKRASTRSTYVVAHNITNCQGLQDFGEFLVKTGIDVSRGERYLHEAADFRICLLRAMGKSVIRSTGNPPFVPLQTLYFHDTPDYGPDPFRNLALGRVQGTYYHYWADMEFHYNFFNPDDKLGQWIANYLQDRGGFVLGCTRARSMAGQPYGWINDNYNAGYYVYDLRRGEVERFLLGFYSRLAFDSTRHVYVTSEGAPFIGYNTHDGGFVGAEYSFPNSAANAETLDMLRFMLIMEEKKDNIDTGVIDLARGTPRAWLAEGKRIQVEDAPTDFGKLSFEIDSHWRAGVISARVSAPQRAKYQSLRIFLRAPDDRPIRRVSVNGKDYKDFDAPQEWVRLPYGQREYHVAAYFQ